MRVKIDAVSKSLDEGDNAGLKVILPIARVARCIDKLFQRLEVKPKLPEFRPQEVKFLGKKICDSGVGSSKEHLPVIEKDQITEHVQKRKDVEVVHMHNGFIEQEPRRMCADTAIQAEEDGQR